NPLLFYKITDVSVCFEFLDIIGIMRNQAGRYECKASNDVATPDFKYVNVVVNYPPTIQKIQSSETPVGRVGMLQCDANAVPKPEFEWFKDDKRMTNTQSINIQMLGTTTILVFSNVSEEDYGNYTCVASNRLGIQYASVFLFRPGTGRDINSSPCVSQSLWLLVVCITLLFFNC
uniref:Ig-like domain-containing protein n=1 Tax=Periophthalmus magnuspinnatus TaxID=409849 RepID=A0A3B3ZMP5_9GOBI